MGPGTKVEPLLAHMGLLGKLERDVLPPGDTAPGQGAES